MTIGIIGFGSFGKFLAEKLSSHSVVKVYDRRERPTTWRADFDEVAACDYVVLSVPLDAYTETLERLATVIPPTSVLVDVCSVKERPIELIRHYLPEQPLVATHPLFGPESASHSLQGMTMVMCPEVSAAEPYAKIKDFAEKLELSIVEMSTAEHDREMAVVQGLTFFIARTLDEMNIHSQRLSTPSFERLLHLAELEQHHSTELFRTIQQGNLYARSARRAFLGAAQMIDSELDNDEESKVV
ncbi:MAG TPA: prephenate dehydrogenase/arogenate dehydrogenase family protein [Candidatus Nanoperiomorbaceae bacterium]|nr:prephenate dehydrogenase/arogenate dehydrogenase family protein [Candidatus Nanoperiomorbaceae bacterium]HMQ97228.1 prephenate dehydrogenase/arogenate dehydrogenase family protein [Candidatus Nanoperiomorbaceae bacterium]HMR86228.1 prephenate dehydrogenase/arogenate dehydrogenase family protein [Candidatus Nanoperiomorbaceae bacterium]HMU12336.1 prephenate dehydrogenase/arogenate dehydrogenase family protein [Candidatus Nanoperiomorbaceae bacterium]